MGKAFHTKVGCLHYEWVCRACPLQVTLCRRHAVQITPRVSEGGRAGGQSGSKLLQAEAWPPPPECVLLFSV